MSEKTLFLLKPDALSISVRTLLARFDFYRQLRANDLSILAKARFAITYDMLINYQPVLAPDFKSQMTDNWKDLIINYQLGENHKGKEHLLFVVEGYNALSKAPVIKRYIRDKYCSPWEKYIPTNLIHAPDNNEEYERDLIAFENVLTKQKTTKNIEQFYNIR